MRMRTRRWRMRSKCFEDGIYRIFADDEELTELGQALPWHDGLVFTFVRLTMLAGW